MKLLLLLLLIGTLAGVPGGTDYVTGTITGNSVNVRVDPSRKAEIVGELQKNQMVNVILTDGEWCAIAPPGEIPGWVAAEFVKDGVVTGERVNLRSGPGIAYARLARLRKGDRLNVLEEKGDWLKVELPSGVRLWVSARYVSVEGETPALQPPLEETRGESDRLLPVSSPPVKSPVTVGEFLPVEEEEGITSLPTPVPRSTPFLSRQVSAYYPAEFTEIKTYTGFVRGLDQPYTREGREVTHELIRPGYRQDVLCHLTSESVELERCHLRKARIWGGVLGGDLPVPVVEVKGVQFLW